ncbi:MAG: zinc metalloprotease HtpX [Myxococcota bacterium]
MINQLKTVFLLGVLSLGLVGLGSFLGTGAMMLFALLALAMNIGAYFYSDRIVLRMNRAEELDERSAPELYAMTRELAANADIPMPRLYLIDEPQPNAFATGRNPDHGVVAVTTGIIRHLSERELRGVIAHELAHIKNRDILIASVAAAVSTAIPFIANAMQFTAIFGLGGDDEDAPSPLAGLALAFLAPIAATFVQLAISRSREFEADATGARIARDPEGLALALERLQQGTVAIPAHVEPATASLYIANPLAGRRLSNLFSTHPDMGERITRLRAMRSEFNSARRRIA